MDVAAPHVALTAAGLWLGLAELAGRNNYAVKVRCAQAAARSAEELPPRHF